METYVVLMNLTERGLRDLKEAPARIEAAAEALEAAGGRLLGFYAVIGGYDYVAIAEVPNDDVARSQLLNLSMLGNVRTTALKAASREEFSETVKRIQPEVWRAAKAQAASEKKLLREWVEETIKERLERAKSG
jgi:uncharacterized protein with GYD domain